jgi:MFS family permease
VGLPFLCIGSFGTALATNIPLLMVWRFVQAFGASPGISVGAGVIGDIYKLEERGTAMGIFFVVSRADEYDMRITANAFVGCSPRTSTGASNRR